MATKPLIKESLFLLNICGVNPANQNWKTKIVAALSLTMVFYFITELTLEFALKWRGWDSVDDLVLYFSFTLVAIKLVFIIANSGKIREFLKSLTKFWSTAEYSAEFQKEIEDIVILVKRLMIIYGSPVITIAALLSKPLFGDTRTLPLHTYHPTDYYKYYDYQAMYIVQMLNFAIAFFTMYSFDVLFLSFITHIICECKILKYRFFNMKIKDDTRNNFLEIKCLVEHHNLILKCVQDLDDIFSVLFLIQFLFSLICICTGLLNIVVSGFTMDINRLLFNVGYLSAFLGQLLIYCAAGAHLKTESESVCDAVYESDWWVKTQPELRRACALVIQRAQKGEELTAGGMFALNLISFTSIIRACSSFFMLAQALYARSKNQ